MSAKKAKFDKAFVAKKLAEAAANEGKVNATEWAIEDWRPLEENEFYGSVDTLSAAIWAAGLLGLYNEFGKEYELLYGRKERGKKPRRLEL